MKIEFDDNYFMIGKAYYYKGEFDEAIKTLGNYSAIVDFGDDISAKVKLKVTAE